MSVGLSLDIYMYSATQFFSSVCT